MTTPKKRGRPPSKWLTLEYGEQFAHAVNDLRMQRREEGRPMSRVQTIRCVLKRRDFAYLQEYNTPKGIRYLEKQILQAAEHWNPYARLRKEFRDAAKLYGAPNYW